jgi:2OG-Fe(II) oxygenase superfamily
LKDMSEPISQPLSTGTRAPLPVPGTPGTQSERSTGRSPKAISQAVTLPIESSDGLKLDPAEARSLGELLAQDYQQADPFPHIVMDGFLPEDLMQKVLTHFPASPIDSDVNFTIGYGGQFKRQVMPEDCDSFSRELFHFFNSRPVLQFLEGLTGIDGLIPDPYFQGGGFHETSRGGMLGVHADFRVNEQLHLQRRMNLLIYLNPVWDDAWFGQLELWDRSMKNCVAKVSPILNRCVIFNTDADTWHGHPDPLATPEGLKRRSMALYYYTASPLIYTEVPTMDTMYKARPHDSQEVKKEALRFQRDQYVNQWLPPVLVRGMHKVARGFKKLGNR